MADEEPPGAEIPYDPGPGWPEPPDPPGPSPAWADARALTAVWRESLPFAAGALTGRWREAFPDIGLSRPWTRTAEPESDADVGQAISAKLHLVVRMLPIVAEAQLLSVEPAFANRIPFELLDDEVSAYGAAVELPQSPLFLDLESERGHSVTWQPETWPLPFDLRGAVIWHNDVGTSVIPFGSVSGRHLIGGTDYQPWVRTTFLSSTQDEWPTPGPGDVFVNADGDALGWVDLDTDSICAHQVAIGTNLAYGAMSVLMTLERLGLPLEERTLPRSARRRAARAGKRIGLVPAGLDLDPQTLSIELDDDAPEPRTDLIDCPLDRAHARLNQAHALWHEALEAYQDPAMFATKLTAALGALRSVTLVLQKQLRHEPGFDEWYAGWQDQMKADPLMRWLIDARNATQKEGDLETLAVAAIRIAGEWQGEEQIIEVDPEASAEEIARSIRLGGGLPERVRREGVLSVERRWTVADLDGREVLDVLAHGYGFLARLIAEAHEREDVAVERCAVTDDDTHHAAVLALAPSGRPPCMAASREARTSRRNLNSGAPVTVALEALRAPSEEQLDATARHYGFDPKAPPVLSQDPVEQSAQMHQMARQILLADGHHETIVWLGRAGATVGLFTMRPDDQRDKQLMVSRLATQVTERGAERVIFTAEAWEAPPIAPDEKLAELRAEERDDRTEALLTCLLQRNGPAVTFRSVMHRDGDVLTLGETERLDGFVPPFLIPIAEAWNDW